MRFAMSDTSSPALRLSRTLLKVLIVLNIAGGVLILACLLTSFVFHGPAVAILRSARPGIDAGLFFPALRIWLLMTLPGIAALHLLLRRALDILATVRLGNPFVLENAARLRTIAWCLLVVQVANLGQGVMARVAAAAHAEIDSDVSLVGWLCVVLLFVLAQVFEEGARMRDDLEAMI
jgi:hypothetical protein